MLRSLLLCSALLAGCYSEEPGVVYGGGGGVVAVDGAPGLIEVSPGVDVIADYDYPVFYSDGEYWRYDGGIWYQSAYWGGGWGLAYNVPYGVRGIRNPAGYAHWGSEIRDHRGYAGGSYRRGGASGSQRGSTGYRSAPARSAPGQGARPMSRGGGRGGGGGFHGGGGGGHGGHGGHR